MTFITKKSVQRRTFLQGIGASLALPLLDAMIPASTALADTPAAPNARFGVVYLPQGFILEQWTPAKAGRDFEFTRILKPLEPLREHVNVITNLGNGAPRAGGHAIAPAMFLSAVQEPKRTEGADIHNGTTIDQVIAHKIGQGTQFPSLELATEDLTTSVGACEVGYSCAYLNTVSWSSPTTPLPMEINPRTVFERLFGGAGNAEQRAARLRNRISILDAVAQQTSRLEKGMGPRDRARLGEYLENVREIERRIQKAEQPSEQRALKIPDAPLGVPEDFGEHVGLMFGLLHLAFQADMTRVFTFMAERELSQRTYPNLGVPDPHHALSHHQNEPPKVEKYARTNTYHASLFADFLEKMRTTPDGEGSLLDHSTIVYGSGMSNGNQHAFDPLPVVIAGSGAGRIAGGRHIVNPAHTSIGNLWVTLAQQFGVQTDKHGDSTGRMEL